MRDALLAFGGGRDAHRSLHFVDIGLKGGRRLHARAPQAAG